MDKQVNPVMAMSAIVVVVILAVSLYFWKFRSTGYQAQVNNEQTQQQAQGLKQTGRMPGMHMPPSAGGMSGAPPGMRMPMTGPPPTGRP